MSENEKIMGPASYFPSIEKKYGFPVSHWFDLLKKQKGLKQRRPPPASGQFSVKASK